MTPFTAHHGGPKKLPRYHAIRLVGTDDWLHKWTGGPGFMYCLFKNYPRIQRLGGCRRSINLMPDESLPYFEIVELTVNVSESAPLRPSGSVIEQVSKKVTTFSPRYETVTRAKRKVRW